MSETLSCNSTVVASREQVWCNLGPESAILNMKNSVYYGLNPVGASIWRLLQEPRRIAEIRDAITDEYNVSREQAEGDLLRILEELMREGLVEMGAKQK